MFTFSFKTSSHIISPSWTSFTLSHKSIILNNYRNNVKSKNKTLNTKMLPKGTKSYTSQQNHKASSDHAFAESIYEHVTASIVHVQCECAGSSHLNTHKCYKPHTHTHMHTHAHILKNRTSIHTYTHVQPKLMHKRAHTHTHTCYITTHKTIWYTHKTQFYPADWNDAFLFIKCSLQRCTPFSSPSL
jgi:hypothetical protein